MGFRTAIKAIIFVSFVHIIALLVGVYSFFENFDVPMHLAGGLVMGMLAMAVHHHLTAQGHLRGLPVWYHIIFVLSFVFSVGVAWEFQEYLIDHTLGLWLNWPRAQTSLADTMLDLALDGVGAWVAFAWFKK